MSHRTTRLQGGLIAPNSTILLQNRDSLHIPEGKQARVSRIAKVFSYLTLCSHSGVSEKERSRHSFRNRGMSRRRLAQCSSQKILQTSKPSSKSVNDPDSLHGLARCRTDKHLRMAHDCLRWCYSTVLSPNMYIQEKNYR